VASRRRGRRALALACLLLQATSALAWAAEGDPTLPADPVLVGAGGIASCDTAGDEATAALIEKLPDATVFAAGDNAYESGTAAQFANCYDKTWGKFKARTHPAPGNHDYATSGAGPYYDYFGAAAGTKGQGWYSYDLGAWHVVVLNSNCSTNGRCAKGSAQEQWLKADLAASGSRCTAAVIHHPRFSSDSIDGNRPEIGPLWDDLYSVGADLVISGHARVYERSAPQTPAGKADPDHGMALFNVGTGGRGHTKFNTPVANSLVRDNTSWGVLKLTLHAGGYDFAFLPVAGAKLTDAGSGTCHGAPDGSDPAGGSGGDPGGGDPVGGDPPVTTALSFLPDADASVAKGSPTTNYGTKSTLLTDASPVHSAYLRFTVSGVEGTVARARLRLWVTNGSGNGPAVYPTVLGLGAATDPPWPESAINWNKRPARTGPALDDLGAVGAGRFVELDVTDAVTGEGAYGFELGSGGTDGTDFASREASTAGRRPQLIVDVASSD
jgi:calcineurin-like phosphoesterase family protein